MGQLALNNTIKKEYEQRNFAGMVPIQVKHKPYMRNGVEVFVTQTHWFISAGIFDKIETMKEEGKFASIDWGRLDEDLLFQLQPNHPDRVHVHWDGEKDPKSDEKIGVGGEHVVQIEHKNKDIQESHEDELKSYESTFQKINDGWEKWIEDFSPQYRETKERLEGNRRELEQFMEWREEYEKNLPSLRQARRQGKETILNHIRSSKNSLAPTLDHLLTEGKGKKAKARAKLFNLTSDQKKQIESKGSVNVITGSYLVNSDGSVTFTEVNDKFLNLKNKISNLADTASEQESKIKKLLKKKQKSKQTKNKIAKLKKGLDDTKENLASLRSEIRHHRPFNVENLGRHHRWENEQILGLKASIEEGELVVARFEEARKFQELETDFEENYRNALEINVGLIEVNQKPQDNLKALKEVGLTPENLDKFFPHRRGDRGDYISPLRNTDITTMSLPGTKKKEGKSLLTFELSGYSTGKPKSFVFIKGYKPKEFPDSHSSEKFIEKIFNSEERRVECGLTTQSWENGSVKRKLYAEKANREKEKKNWRKRIEIARNRTEEEVETSKILLAKATKNKKTEDKKNKFNNRILELGVKRIRKIGVRVNKNKNIINNKIRIFSKNLTEKKAELKTAENTGRTKAGATLNPKQREILDTSINSNIEKKQKWENKLKELQRNWVVVKPDDFLFVKGKKTYKPTLRNKDMFAQYNTIEELNTVLEEKGNLKNPSQKAIKNINIKISKLGESLADLKEGSKKDLKKKASTQSKKKKKKIAKGKDSAEGGIKLKKQKSPNPQIKEIRKKIKNIKENVGPNLKSGKSSLGKGGDAPTKTKESILKKMDSLLNEWECEPERIQNSDTFNTLYSEFQSGEDKVKLEGEDNQYKVSTNGVISLVTENFKEALSKYYSSVSRIMDSQNNNKDLALELFGEHVLNTSRNTRKLMAELDKMTEVKMLENLDYSQLSIPFNSDFIIKYEPQSDVFGIPPRTYDETEVECQNNPGGKIGRKDLKESDYEEIELHPEEQDPIEEEPSEPGIGTDGANLITNSLNQPQLLPYKQEETRRIREVEPIVKVKNTYSQNLHPPEEKVIEGQRGVN